MPEITGFKIPNHDEIYMYADEYAREQITQHGLGTVNPVESQDDCKENGFYNPSGSAQTTVYKLSDNFIYQDMRTTNNYGNQVITTRQFYNGAWGDVEHVNPPMVLNTEYRTTQRWNGKAVYTKMVNCGYLSAVGSTKEYSHGASATNIINSTGTLSTGDLLPYYNTNTEIQLSCTPNNIKIRSIAWEYGTPAVTDVQATVQIWYTKN